MDYFWGASEWASHGAVENNGELSAVNVALVLQEGEVEIFTSQIST